MLTNKRPVKVTCVHPGGIKTNIARNADQAESYDHDKLSKEFDKLAHMSPDKAARIILRGVERGRARVLIGWDAYALDAFVRFAGPAYQGITARFSKSRGL